MSDPLSSSSFSRRRVLGLGLGAAAALPLASGLSGCAGASTTGGGGGSGAMQFYATQFSQVEEKQRYEAIVKKFLTDPPVSFNVAPSTSEFLTQIKTQVQAKKVSFDLVGGLYGDLAPVADQLEDLDDLAGDATAAGVPAELMKLGKLNGSTQKFIPWMQATYVVAVNKKALQWLPGGADVNALTYDQYLAWAKAAKAGNGGKAVFGMPCGPKGLYHRFFQGYLLPSFTGGQITTFAGADAQAAWAYMKELWANMNPASTNYDNMQDPLASGEVLVAWDHVARLVGAPKAKPDEWIMVPAPSGPKGLGYMLIVAGLAVPRGGDKAKAGKTIKALLKNDVQGETLKQNAFFPVTKGDLPGDLPPAVSLEAKAVQAQQTNSKAVVALPPVGVGAKDAELGQAFKDTFTQICLQNKPVAEVVSAQAKVIQKILDEVKVPCWAPDPASNGQPCKVG
ncbi:carbohydrate ABC transporter substrate-binding protein [Naumannella sp. ID2617S]|nr:carbohydrate ABC transporter substrate-binding protein [Naumannella sp. ID2617S]